MTKSQSFGPINSTERIAFMDSLRGFAVFGIFLVNMSMMAAPSMAYGSFAVFTDPVSFAVSLARHLLADGAFIFLFSLLFGASFGLMMDPFGSRQSGIGLPAYYRRLFLIGVLGFFHVTVLWFGDILMIYAMSGLFLPFFRRRKSRTLLIWAVLLFILPTLFFAGLLLIPLADSALYEQLDLDYETAIRSWIAYLNDGYLLEDFGQVARTRWTEYFYEPVVIFFTFFQCLGMMLLGLWMIRVGGFRQKPGERSIFRKALLWIIPTAIIGKLAYVYLIYDESSYGLSIICFVLSTFGGPALGILHFLGLRRLLRKERFRWLQKSLAAVGRMALTQYLLQSTFISLLFYGYGLGLYGKVPPLSQILIVCGFFSLQCLISLVWLRHFPMGPLEWVLRKFTYLR
ncbi:MAG: DUF418 domain-containing protein [Verrucomicrobiota bacterium]